MDADLLGENSVKSQAEREVTAKRLFTSPPHPQPLAFEALKTPARNVPPTPGMALQQKLETRLEKSLGSHIYIQIDQKMGSFQANILEAMKSLRDVSLLAPSRHKKHSDKSKHKLGPDFCLLPQRILL